MKINAFYLPQFHEIQENNEWWGKGFTEWTNTKKSSPLFKGHNQPREPKNNYYYNLLDAEAREWQAKIARDHGIYGFCYYHYWFNGQKLLEKPIEMVLEKQSPDFPFCFSWANESWSKAWDGQDKHILMKQDYGAEEDWITHFNYLLPFFKDKRYIRIDNKPVFIIYRSASIPECDKMLAMWNNLAKKNGIEGIYFITTLTSFEIDTISKQFNAQIEFEPMYTYSHYFDIGKKITRIIKLLFRKYLKLKSHIFINSISYDYLWKKIINRKKNTAKTILGAFVDWDNSPRKGKESFIVTGASPEKFEKYLKAQIKKDYKTNQTGFIFINAWNEWAEGAYLEPDKKNGFKYLKAVKNALENSNN